MTSDRDRLRRVAMAKRKEAFKAAKRKRMQGLRLLQELEKKEAELRKEHEDASDS